MPSSTEPVRACCQRTNRSRADSASTRSTADSQFASKSSWRQTVSRWSVSSARSAPVRAPWSVSTWITEPKLAAVLRAPSARACRARNHCRGQARIPASWLPDSRTGSSSGTTGRSAAVSGCSPHQRSGWAPGASRCPSAAVASASRASRLAACSRSPGDASGSTADLAQLADQRGQGQRPPGPSGPGLHRHPQLGQEAGRLVTLALGAGDRGHHQPRPGPGAGDVEQPALLGDPVGVRGPPRSRRGGPAGPPPAATRAGVRPARCPPARRPPPPAPTPGPWPGGR